MYATNNLNLNHFVHKSQRADVIVAAHQTIGDVVTQLKTPFDALEQNRPKSVHNLFTPISGDTLWQNRPKNYAYRL